MQVSQDCNHDDSLAGLLWEAPEQNLSPSSCRLLADVCSLWSGSLCPCGQPLRTVLQPISGGGQYPTAQPCPVLLEVSTGERGEPRSCLLGDPISPATAGKASLLRASASFSISWLCQSQCRGSGDQSIITQNPDCTLTEKIFKADISISKILHK